LSNIRFTQEQQRASLERRFWICVRRNGKNGCWRWVGFIDRDGYGVLGAPARKNKNLRAHRVAWLLHNGPVPPGLWVLHHCDNPPCCNPKHLWVGTPRENALDMIRKNRHGAPKGAKHYAAKLTAAGVRDARKRFKQGETLTALAIEYQVSTSTLGEAVHRYTWKSVK
jgi:hypothetical protein